MGVLRLVQCEMTEEIGAQFVLELQMLESPRDLAERLVDTVFFQDTSVHNLHSLTIFGFFFP
jgi:hypothetical protein